MIWAAVTTSAAADADVGDVSFPPSFDSDNGAALELTGVGLLRYRVFFKGYAAALYLDDVPGAADAVLDDFAKRLEIEYFWPISAEDFARVTIEGIARNVDAASFERLRGPIARFNTFYRNVRSGDRYALTYLPGVGTELALNGEKLGVIEGKEFSSAIFAIWFGEDPVSEPLKRQLLGDL